MNLLDSLHLFKSQFNTATRALESEKQTNWFQLTSKRNPRKIKIELKMCVFLYLSQGWNVFWLCQFACRWVRINVQFIVRDRRSVLCGILNKQTKSLVKLCLINTYRIDLFHIKLWYLTVDISISKSLTHDHHHTRLSEYGTRKLCLSNSFKIILKSFLREQSGVSLNDLSFPLRAT